jgi:hypothetical protein
LTTTIQKNTSFILLLLLAVLFAISSKAQQSVKAVASNFTELSIYWDSSQISLSKHIPDNEYWFNLLKEDTTVISFFKARTSNNACYIYIASINRIVGTAFQYELMIYSRLLKAKPSELLSFGYATYHVTLAPLLNGRRSISDIKFHAILI